MKRHGDSTEPDVMAADCPAGRPWLSMHRWQQRDSRRLHNATAGLAMRADRKTEVTINPAS